MSIPRRTSSARHGPLEVRSGAVLDPNGERRVLLQLPDGFVLLWPDDARSVADLLRAAADEVERLAGS